MDRHDHIGAGQQPTAAAQPLIRPLQPEVPFAQGRADDARHQPKKQQRNNRDRSGNHLADHAQRQQPAARPCQQSLPFPPFPDVEIEQEIHLLDRACHHGDHRQRKFEQSEGQHSLRPHGEQDRCFVLPFARRDGRAARLLVAHQFSQTFSLRFGKIAQRDFVLAARPGFEPHLGQAEQARDRLLFEADILNALVGYRACGA